jgi:hypothetical protein
MKKLFSLVLALLLAFASIPAQATLTNSNTATQNGNALFYSALITATGNDTTDPADSNVIANLDGSIKDICAIVKATNQTGSSPTLKLIFLGGPTSSGPWYIVQTDQADTAGTTADADAVGTLDINTASSTNVAQGVCTSNFGIDTLPPYVKIRVDVGGTGTPGWTGVLSALVKR